jgi:hypothetical protein
VIFVRSEVSGATAVVAALGAPRSIGRAVTRAAMAHMTVTALDSKITTDPSACDIADDAATDEANRTCDDGPGDGSYGRASHPIVRARSRGRDTTAVANRANPPNALIVLVLATLATHQADHYTWPYLGRPRSLPASAGLRVWCEHEAAARHTSNLADGAWRLGDLVVSKRLMTSRERASASGTDWRIDTTGRCGKLRRPTSGLGHQLTSAPQIADVSSSLVSGHSERSPERRLWANSRHSGYS